MHETKHDNAVPEGDLQLVTISNAARFLSVSRGTLYYLLRTGQLASVHIGRSRRIPTEELRRFVRSRVALEARRNTVNDRTSTSGARKVG
jgi:excisionase family DNA binding protein